MNSSLLTCILGFPLGTALALTFVPRNFRVVLRGAAVSPAQLDSLRSDEAPRGTATGAIAPLKDADDWDVVGAVVIAAPAGAAPFFALSRRGVLLPLAALAVAVLAGLAGLFVPGRPGGNPSATAAEQRMAERAA